MRSQPTEQWWELYVQVPDSLSDAASECLHTLGSEAVVFHEGMTLAPQHEPCMVPTSSPLASVVLQGAVLYDPSTPPQLQALQQFLGACAQHTPGVQFYACHLPSLDYQNQWQQFFQPLCVGERLVIRPPWHTAPVPAHLVSLTLNPGPAFGTGTHPSTHLCLQMLTRLADRYQGATLLDVGCGSGILSLAALQLGWHSALGVDIDPLAIPVAQQNAALNGLQERVHYLQGSWQMVTEQFTCITANIYLGPLVDMLQPLSRWLAPHGLLMLSGVLASQEETLSLALAQAHLAVHTRLTAEGWLALAVQHAPTAA